MAPGSTTGHSRPRRSRLTVTLVALAIVAVVLAAIGAVQRAMVEPLSGEDQRSTVEPLLDANWVGAFDHDPTTGELHALVDLRASAAVPSEHRFLTYDPASETVTVHREGFAHPFGPWVGVARDATVWAFSAGAAHTSSEPFLWQLDVSGEIAAVPIVRLADLGCAALNQGPVEELGVWVDEGVLRPKVLLLDGSGAERVALDVAHELRLGPDCGLETRELTTTADLERNLQNLAIDGWLETAAAGPDVHWVDTAQELEIQEVSAGLLAELTGNNPCERVKDRVRWQGRRMDLRPCRGIGALPTSGHVLTQDGLVAGFVLRGIGVLRP